MHVQELSRFEVWPNITKKNTNFDVHSLRISGPSLISPFFVVVVFKLVMHNKVELKKTIKPEKQNVPKWKKKQVNSIEPTPCFFFSCMQFKYKNTLYM